MDDVVAIRRVHGRKNYQALADHLREQILQGAIPGGVALPNERELGERTGISRGSVREALRVLEVEGFISIRPGRKGGSTTRRPGADGVSRSVGALVRGQMIPFDAVLGAREALEPALASLAARHRTDADLAELGAVAEEMTTTRDDNARFIAANSKWHWAVARASHNLLLVAMVAAVSDVLHQSNVEQFVSAEVGAAVIRAHQRIADAIREGDADAAFRRMSRHVRKYRELVVPLAPEDIVVDADDRWKNLNPG